MQLYDDLRPPLRGCALCCRASSTRSPIERLVTSSPPAAASATGWRTEFDASIWGGGAVLRSPAGTITEYRHWLWDQASASDLGVQPELPKFQTFWELATLLMALVTWGSKFRDSSVAVLGDNTGALQTALSLTGRMPNLAVAREIAWRRVRCGWVFEVGHLPSEHNLVADALSRVADPSPPPWPAWELSAATWAKPPVLQHLWRALPGATASLQL